jgi:hypothetical protein
MWQLPGHMKPSLKLYNFRFIIFAIWKNLKKLRFSEKKLRRLSPQANYTDRATAAVGEVVPTFAGRGCCVVSTTNSHGR